LIIAHALLGNNDLFRTVDDEVPTLVKIAVFAISDSLQFIHLFELAELAPQHDRHLSDKDFVFLEFFKHLLYFLLSLLSQRIFLVEVIQLFLRHRNVRVHLC
jgi:hypothetical protein